VEVKKDAIHDLKQNAKSYKVIYTEIFENFQPLNFDINSKFTVFKQNQQTFGTVNFVFIMLLIFLNIFNKCLLNNHSFLLTLCSLSHQFL